MIYSALESIFLTGLSLHFNETPQINKSSTYILHMYLLEGFLWNSFWPLHLKSISPLLT